MLDTLRQPRRTLALLAIAAPLLAGRPVAAQETLRYGWRPGDRLIYEQRAQALSEDTRGPGPTLVQQAQVWILEEKPAGLLTVIDVAPVVDGGLGPTRGLLARRDPRGQPQFPADCLPLLLEADDAQAMIPPLPRPLWDGRAWNSAPDLLGRFWRCTRAGPDARFDRRLRIDFVVEDPTGVSQALGRSLSGSFWFDPGEALVARIETRAEDQRLNQALLTVTLLRERRRMDERERASCARAATDFLRALRQERRFLDRLALRGADAAAALAGVERVWDEYKAERGAAASGPFVRWATSRQESLRARVPELRARAELAASWLGRPAAEWSLQSPDGATLTSEAFRGSRLIECAWSAQSEASLWSLASLRALAKAADVDARIVCMNVDRDMSKGSAAAKSLGAGLTHVLAGPPMDARAPQELPIWRVLDENRVVLRVAFGWQADIRDLLAGPEERGAP